MRCLTTRRPVPTVAANKRWMGEEISEQLDIVPMQIRVTRQVHKVYGCRVFEAARVTADKPANSSKRA